MEVEWGGGVNMKNLEKSGSCVQQNIREAS